VWVEGVLQRLQTKQLKAYLKAERETEDKKMQALKDEMEEIRVKIMDLSDTINKRKRDADKISIAAKAFYRSYQKFSAGDAPRLYTYSNIDLFQSSHPRLPPKYITQNSVQPTKSVLLTCLFVCLFA
jgi:hypothetical protein